MRCVAWWVAGARLSVCARSVVRPNTPMLLYETDPVLMIRERHVGTQRLTHVGLLTRDAARAAGSSTTVQLAVIVAEEPWVGERERDWHGVWRPWSEGPEGPGVGIRQEIAVSLSVARDVAVAEHSALEALSIVLRVSV